MLPEDEEAPPVAEVRLPEEVVADVRDAAEPVNRLEEPRKLFRLPLAPEAEAPEAPAPVRAPEPDIEDATLAAPEVEATPEDEPPRLPPDSPPEEATVTEVPRPPDWTLTVVPPPRPPRSCGTTRETNLSALVTPVRRSVRSREPVWIVTVRVATGPPGPPVWAPGLKSWRRAQMPNATRAMSEANAKKRLRGAGEGARRG
jgi:hypothetical protein